MRHSFFTRLFLGNLLVIAIIVAVGGVVSYRRLNETHLAENENHQRRIVRFAQVHFQNVWAQSPGRIEPLDRECKQFAVESPIRLTVIARSGRVLGDSQADPNTMANHKTADRPEVTEALAGRAGRDMHTSKTLGVKYRYLAEPIRQGGAVVGVVRVAMPIPAIAQSQTFIRDALLWAALAAVAAAVVLALLLSWIWYAPLRQITRTARVLASGDLSQDAAIGGSGELAQLAAALNLMRDSLSRKINQIAAQREDLSAVVENIREGVIALDSHGRIVLMNRPAVKLLAPREGELTGKPLHKVIGVIELVEAYNEVVRGAESVGRQVEADIHSRRYVLDIGSARLAEGSPDGPAVLLVVRDITDLVRMAAVKAEFVANASHELRTPLATIRAAVDSLAAIEPGDTEQVRRITEILDRHTMRLEEMTNDLLNLHAVESLRHRPRPEALALDSPVSWVRQQYASRAGEKGVSLATECEDPSAKLQCDATLLELILQNLLDNAIKFTPPGGKVSVRFEAEGDTVIVTVADTGCGIPSDMQGRVFERFFQVDASRAGQPKVRGTGLGLAIVKHACERLGATVELHSREGQGTTVTVRLPRHSTQ